MCCGLLLFGGVWAVHTNLTFRHEHESSGLPLDLDLGYPHPQYCKNDVGGQRSVKTHERSNLKSRNSKSDERKQVLLRLSMTRVRMNRVFPLRCLKISDPFLFFRIEASQIYSLEITQNILPTDEENQRSIQESALTSFPKKLNTTESSKLVILSKPYKTCHDY